MTVSIAGDSPPSPRASPASNSTWPASSVLRVARISLLRATSRTSAFDTASVDASELTNTWMPSLPENADQAQSETMNHCVASVPSSSLALPGPLAPAVMT